MRILVATDAWHPQVNGVVRTYDWMARHAPEFGVELDFFTPEGLPGFPMPTYPEIRVSLVGRRHIGRRIQESKPDFIHVATEGPIGLGVRRYCLRQGLRFTTAYHTRFPEYVSRRFPVPESWGYAFERWFHNAGHGILCATRSLREELDRRGFRNLRHWARGADLERFHPRSDRRFGVEGPVFLYVGRVAVEKNIEAFLELDLPGRKVVVGSGPQLASLRRKYPQVHFTGGLDNGELAAAYASGDVFVFPSRTDTFGIVLLEAMASGLPVAAYPVTGPMDVVIDGVTGALDEDLGKAALRALEMDRTACRRQAERFSWRECTRQFIEGVSGRPIAGSTVTASPTATPGSAEQDQ
jgi:glycosyltransferase involved in cell wall biosynthesis